MRKEQKEIQHNYCERYSFKTSRDKQVSNYLNDVKIVVPKTLSIFCQLLLFHI